MRLVSFLVGFILVGSGMVLVVWPGLVGAPNRAVPIVELIKREDAVNKSDKVTIVAVGDVMLGRYVGNLLKMHGARYPFAMLGDVFDEYDHALVNLEGPITKVNLYPNESPHSTMKFRFAPAVAATLAEEGVTIANLANNHSLDQGNDGFRDTHTTLRDAHILYSGSATNDPAFFGVATTTKGVPLLFVGFNASWPHDEDSVLEYLKAQHDDVFIVMSVHWGEEYKLVQNATQRALAHAFIDAGADIVIGHHPHVVQGIERYRDKLVFYSLGNFIFDQYFSKDVQEGLAVGIMLGNDAVEVRLIPLVSVQSQPKIMESSQKEEFLQALAERSDVALREEVATGNILR